jgi:hypothetical protein
VNIHIYNDYALLHAAEYGHLDVVQFLVENGANIHSRNDSALLCAARNGHLNTVQYLVENGADISYLLNDKGNPTKITKQVLTEDQIEEAKQLFTVRKIITD